MQDPQSNNSLQFGFRVSGLSHEQKGMKVGGAAEVETSNRTWHSNDPETRHLNLASTAPCIKGSDF